MARPPMSAERRRHQMIQASQRAIARGERPTYHVRMTQDGRWTVDAAEWLSGTADSRTEALAAARSMLAAMLEVDEGAFELTATAVDDR